MKKILLSVFVVSAFVLYSIHQKIEADNAKVIPPSTTTLSNPTPAGTTPPNGNSQGNGMMGNGSGMGHMGMMYRDGQYTGGVVDAFYGNVQVKATVQNGKITDITFLDYPQDRNTSLEISNQAMPYLKQEAITAQSANVDIISGATQTSQAFIESLTSALSQAQ